MIQTDAEILAAVAEELKHADARSDVYKEGMADVLRYRVHGVAIPPRYRPGTIECDAYYAGNSHGHALWRKLDGADLCEARGKRHD
jgi:hypothetical protein